MVLVSEHIFDKLLMGSLCWAALDFSEVGEQNWQPAANIIPTRTAWLAAHLLSPGILATLYFGLRQGGQDEL